MLRKSDLKLYCFSPPVMLATFVVELALAVYTVWRYKMTNITRLAVAILLSLSAFQISEYMICGGLGLTNIEWARAGYVAITLLPALGIHMLSEVADKKTPGLLIAAYTSCISFVAYYLLNTGSVSAHTCAPNYAVFQSPYISSQLFGGYYYGWLLVGVYLAWHWGRQLPKARKNLHGMMMGYLVFLVPTTTVNIVNPSTTRAIPSIMCGFAVFLAFVIVTKVLPGSVKIRESAKRSHRKLELKFPFF